MKPRAVMWVQTRLGLGHLSRALNLCGALSASGFEVTLAHGGPPARSMRIPDGVAMVQLPIALAPDLETSLMTDADGRPVDDKWRSERVGALHNVLESAKPDIFITETFPLGRRLFSFELAPTLEYLRGRSPRPLVVSSVRDIVTRPEKQAKADAMVDLALGAYDLILCHADPTIVRLPDSFPETSKLEHMTRYTGYISETIATPVRDRRGVVISGGGGAVGRALFEAAIAARRLWQDDDEIWTVVTGPRLEPAAVDQLRATAPEGVEIEGAVQDLTQRYANARLVVAQAGYNTVCEALSSGTNLIVVPYATAKETEQTIRAEAFQRRGLLTGLKESELSPQVLCAAMQRAIKSPPPPKFAVDGGASSARILRQALKDRVT